MTTQDTPTPDQLAAFAAWKVDYALTLEPNYSADTEHDCKEAFGAGWQAAIAHDRQQRGEPVGYIAAGLLSLYLEKCREPGVDLHIENLPVASRPPNECATGAVPIFLSPQPAAPAVKEPSTVAEPVKGETAYSYDMKALAARNLRSYLGKASFSVNVDRQAALNCVEVLKAKAEPVNGGPVGWDDAQRITDLPEVDGLLQAFADEPTGDAGTEVVRAVMQAVRHEAEPVKVPSDKELITWAGEEQFFLFCDEDEFLQIAREVLARYGAAQPAASAKFWQSHDRWLALRFEPDGDYVSVPRGLLGAACSAIDEKRYEPILLAELRRYTTGDPSAPVAAQPENIRAGDPYDDPAFESLCREHQIWGTAESALCAVFWRAGKIGAQPSVPDGWKLVPMDLTDEMARSGYEYAGTSTTAVRGTYAAMLAAAPTPPADGNAGLGIPPCGGALCSESDHHPLCNQAQQDADGVDAQPDMFWDDSNNEQCYTSLHDAVTDIDGYVGLEVGSEITLQAARRLPNLVVRITAVPESDDFHRQIEYEIIGSKQGDRS